jgi:hypothetical protein
VKPVRSVSTFLSVAAVVLAHASLAQAQGRGGTNPPEPPTLKGKVAAYEADASISVETRARGGQTNKTEFSIAKGKTKIELGAGIQAIEPGVTVSVWADKDDPKAAARILAEPEAPTVRGKVVAYEADKSITVETRTRGGEARTTEFALVKGKTLIELTGVKAIEAGMTVSVWAEKDNPKNAAKVAAQGAQPGGRGRGGQGAAPADRAENAKPAASAPTEKAEDPVDVAKVLEAYKSNLPTDKNLEWYTLDWVNSLGEAKERAARENRPILFIHTNKEGDLFCSLC